MNRRAFIQWLTGLGSALAFSSALSAPISQQHTRTIPSSGERLPVIGLGTWITFGIDPEDKANMNQREQVLREFLRLGGGVLDSSPMYGNAEKVIGLCLERIGHHKGLFSATKVWTRGHRQGFFQMEQSQALWGLPQLDLMQVHNLLDWETHLPSLRAMKEEGKFRYVGVTTSHGRRHEELIKIMRTEPLDFVQFTYNLLDREAEQYLLPMAADRGIAVIINRPFQRGGLFDHVGRQPLPAWASEIECKTWAQFFLKFIVSHPAVTCAIPATSRVDHLKENMQAAYGPLPDMALRKKMVDTIRAIS
ncbi:MAG: aldo/keto reductase [Gammaproteobacteria bacterium]|nr:aldo/keto reductase [Gammaproteobacteria bacterium]